MNGVSHGPVCTVAMSPADHRDDEECTLNYFIFSMRQALLYSHLTDNGGIHNGGIHNFAVLVSGDT